VTVRAAAQWLGVGVRELLSWPDVDWWVAQAVSLHNAEAEGAEEYRKRNHFFDK
jgi:hypothetical protein